MPKNDGAGEIERFPDDLHIATSSYGLTVMPEERDYTELYVHERQFEKALEERDANKIEAVGNEDVSEIRRRRAEKAEQERDSYRKALEFYADPETYFGIGFLSDPPCGEFIEDFSDCGPQLGEKPGAKARAALTDQRSQDA